MIARDHAINERDVTRIRHAAGIPPRGERVRAIPPAMRVLQEARALLRAQSVGRNKRGEAERIAPDDAAPIAPDDAAPVAPDDAGGAMRGVYHRAGQGPDPLADCPLRTHSEPAHPFSDASAIARLERLIEQELAALEATRAELGALADAPTDTERRARILSILTQTLQRLMRLRAGVAPEQGSYDDDDIPADIDEFRRDLARRIVACLESRPDDGSAGGDCGPAPDETR
ncbi:MAG: hypothetical protein E6G97_05345 [Alphaproteobacteria bacterium]|nr:MAG: hypothetical protein E6G97_05345 [Alphaproteobacteria bacterium]